MLAFSGRGLRDGPIRRLQPTAPAMKTPASETSASASARYRGPITFCATLAWIS